MPIQPVFEYHSDNVSVPVNLPDGTTRLIEISSGYAFGTGSHFTTRLCIQMLEHIFYVNKFQSVLDVGCGSGILAISSAFMGAEQITAIDIEKRVIAEAVKNAEKNDVSEKIEIVHSGIKSVEGSFDIITANILTEHLIDISSDIISRLNSNGHIVLSGIRLAEADIVIDEFSKSCSEFIRKLTDEDWCCLLLKKI